MKIFQKYWHVRDHENLHKISTGPWSWKFSQNFNRSAVMKIFTKFRQVRGHENFHKILTGPGSWKFSQNFNRSVVMKILTGLQSWKFSKNNDTYGHLLYTLPSPSWLQAGRSTSEPLFSHLSSMHYHSPVRYRWIYENHIALKTPILASSKNTGFSCPARTSHVWATSRCVQLSKFKQSKAIYPTLRPSSDTILNMSRIEFRPTQMN